MKPFFKTCLFDDLDLYDAVKAISIPDLKAGLSLWSALSVPISTDSIETLRVCYPELSPSVQNIGLHDLILDDSQSNSDFLKAWKKIGTSVINRNSGKSMIDYAKRGIPSALRPIIWKYILQSDLNHNEDPHVRGST